MLVCRNGYQRPAIRVGRGWGRSRIEIEVDLGERVDLLGSMRQIAVTWEMEASNKNKLRQWKKWWNVVLSS